MKVLVTDFLDNPALVLLNNFAEFIQVIDGNLEEIREYRIEGETDAAIIERLVNINGDKPLTFPAIGSFYWNSSARIITVSFVTPDMFEA